MNAAPDSCKKLRGRSGKVGWADRAVLHLQEGFTGTMRLSKSTQLQGLKYNSARRFGRPGTLKPAKLKKPIDFAATCTPINLPSRDDIPQVCRSLRKQGFRGRFGTAKAGHAAAYRRLPLGEGEEGSAVVTRRHPADG